MPLHSTRCISFVNSNVLCTICITDSCVHYLYAMHLLELLPCSLLLALLEYIVLLMEYGLGPSAVFVYSVQHSQVCSKIPLLCSFMCIFIM